MFYRRMLKILQRERMRNDDVSWKMETKTTYTENQRAEMSWTYNEEGGIGEFGSHKTYLKQKWQKNDSGPTIRRVCING